MCQNVPALFPVREKTLDLLPEFPAMVMMQDVAQFMYHNIIDCVLRRHHQPPAEIQAVLSGAGTPSSLCSIDSNRCWRYSHFLCIKSYPATKLLPCNLSVKLLCLCAKFLFASFAQKKCPLMIKCLPLIQIFHRKHRPQQRKSAI